MSDYWTQRHIDNPTGDVVDTRVAWLPIPDDAPMVLTEHKAYNDRHRPMRPKAVQLAWERKNGDPWELRTATVHGNPFKKDGTPSVADTECQYVEWGKAQQDIPLWLKFTVKRNEPKS